MKVFQSFRPRLRWCCSGLLLGALLATACQNDETAAPLSAPVYSGDVVTSWLALQLKLALAAPPAAAAPPASSTKPRPGSGAHAFLLPSPRHENVL